VTRLLCLLIRQLNRHLCLFNCATRSVHARPCTILIRQQNKTYFVVGLIILTVSLLSACSPLPRIETDSEPQQWLEHQIAVSEIKSWNIKGRIAVQNGKESATATLHWNQINSNYELRFIAPLGQGTYILKGSSEGVIMQGPNNEVLTAETPEKLMNEGLGWAIHLAGLMYWVRGIPEPDINYTQLLLDEKGRLSDMKQSGFTVSVLRYTEQNGVSLPEKLFIKSDNIQLRMVIQNWNI